MRAALEESETNRCERSVLRPRRAWHTDWAASVLLWCGLAVFFSRWIQHFPIPGWVDAGIYQGYAINLPSLVIRYGFSALSYQGSRLSYVLVLYASHRLASPEIAQYLQLAFFYLLAVLSVLSCGYRSFGRGPALVGTAFLAFNPLFFSALCFGNGDGAALAYVALALVLLFGPSGLAGRKRALVAAGAACACACTAHPFAFAALVGLLVAYHLSADVGWSGCGRYLYLLVGALLAIAVLGSIGTTFGLTFFFLSYSFRMTGMLARGFGANYLKPASEWLYLNYRVLAPLILGSAAVAVLLGRPAPVRTRPLLGACLAPMLPYSMFLYMNLFGRFPALQGRHYVTPILPLLALSVFALVREVTGEYVSRRLLVLVFLAGLPTVAVAAGLVRSPTLGPAAARLTFWSLAAFGGAFSAVLFIARRTGREKTVAFLVAASLVLSTACFALSEDTLHVYKVSTGDDYKEVYLGASHLVRSLEQSEVGPLGPLFWFDRESLNARVGLRSTYYVRFGDEPRHFNYFDTFASYYLWDRALLATSVQEVDEQKLARVLRQPIVFLGPDRQSCEEALSRVRALGYRTDVLYWLAYPGRRFSWVSAVFHVTALAHAEP